MTATISCCCVGTNGEIMLQACEIKPGLNISEPHSLSLKGNFYQVSSETLKKCYGIIVKIQIL